MLSTLKVRYDRLSSLLLTVFLKDRGWVEIPVMVTCSSRSCTVNAVRAGSTFLAVGINRQLVWGHAPYSGGGVFCYPRYSGHRCGSSYPCP